MPIVTFMPAEKSVTVPPGALVTEALQAAGLEIALPCGGQGRCGRCVVVVAQGAVRRRSTIRLAPADLAAGYALACQTVIEGNVVIRLLEPEKIERRLVTDQTVRKPAIPFPYSAERDQTIRMLIMGLQPPTLTDAIDDYARLERGLAGRGLAGLEIPLPLLRSAGQRLRQADWRVQLVVETDHWRRPKGPPRLVEILSAAAPDHGGSATAAAATNYRPKAGLYGLAIDIGTTTVSAFLVDLSSGEVLDSAAEYNGQIARGEDVISRIIYAGKNGGLDDLTALVRGTINELIDRLSRTTGVVPERIYKATVAGNSTMIHLFLGVPPDSIRLEPYITTVNHPPPVEAAAAGLNIHPLASVDCLPGVASYVGADITAGALAAGLAEADELTLFIDVGTNGEMVLGTRDWLVACAASAGPAFEGAGVVCGMRATRGAIDEVWLNSQTYEPNYRVIGNGRPKGLCGSGLISLLAELFVTGVIDKGGRFKLDLATPRLRQGEHGAEYVVAWAAESETGRDIVLTGVDVDNLMRTKAAIYAGFSVLARSVGVNLMDVRRLLVGGSFGKYLNIEKAVQIGLLPDLPWERVRFLGNTALTGAYMALLSRDARARIRAIAEKMTYIELSADNAFFDAFTSALFLPHTDLRLFPSVAQVLT